MSKVIVDTLENTAGTFTSAVDSLGASTTLGAVGTYAFLASNVIISEGNTTSGSNLRYTCHAPGLAIGAYATGTWRAMGKNARTGFADATVFVRIS